MNRFLARAMCGMAGLLLGLGLLAVPGPWAMADDVGAAILPECDDGCAASHPLCRGGCTAILPDCEKHKCFDKPFINQCECSKAK